ncbi:50S ribosomal subunit protein L11 [Candidatus Hodgkinia cicadicola]|uniref:Large ribosomal subunit protein uL11 n=1 Tax=Candidatus Hodgkinia cicadicola TaxID=573658 RepID=A0ABX4MJW1_9HYPH|nr:50S ribosomal subunit protein L11 [Candidatus Hodgkinia cicadicola]
MKLIQGSNYIKLRMIARMAKPNPSINVILGPRKINIVEFCKKFNELTANNNNLEALCVKIYLYPNKDYNIVINNPSITCLIRRYLSLKEDLNTQNKELVASKINKQCILKLIRKKKTDINTFRIKYAIKLIIGSIKSIGIIIGN